MLSFFFCKSDSCRGGPIPSFHLPQRNKQPSLSRNKQTENHQHQHDNDNVQQTFTVNIHFFFLLFTSLWSSSVFRTIILNPRMKQMMITTSTPLKKHQVQHAKDFYFGMDVNQVLLMTFISRVFLQNLLLTEESNHVFQLVYTVQVRINVLFLNWRMTYFFILQWRISTPCLLNSCFRCLWSSWCWGKLLNADLSKTT